MAEYELVIKLRLYQVEEGAWRAEGETAPIFLGGSSQYEVMGYVASGVEALCHWIVASLPSGDSVESYCESLGLECKRLSPERSRELTHASFNIDEVIADASRQLTATQRLDAPEPTMA